MREVPRPEALDGGFHHHLLRDEARLHGYAKAIAAAVRPGDVVADVGSGTGVLSFLAARAGAARVFAVEANTNSYRKLLQNVRRNGMTGVVVPVLADGTEWRPTADVDVLVCELMETGLLHEPIAAVMRNVHAWDRLPREFVPCEVELQVEGVTLRDTFLGYRAPLSGFRATGGDEPVTDLVAYARYDFARVPPPERCEARVTLTATQDARLGGIQLRTTSRLPGGVALGESPGYCTPFVLALDEPIDVKQGDRVEVALDYEFSYTSEPFRFDVRRA